MSSDIRAALDRLVKEADFYSELFSLETIAAARAALAAEPVGEGPSDEDLLQVAIDTRLYRFQATAGDPVQYELTEAQINAYARAVLSRWGRPAAPPAPEVGEGPSDEEGERLQWYSYDPEEGIELYSSKEEAASAAESIMGSYQVSAYSDGWHEDMELVSWGALAPVEQAQIVARGPTEPGDECEEWVRYELRPARWGRPAALAEPVGEDKNGCARIELVTAIHCLASHVETACSDLDGDDLRKAENDIAHARRIAAKHNQNGPGCPQFPTAAPPAPEPGEAGEIAGRILTELQGFHPRHRVFGSLTVERLTRAATLLQQLSAPAPVVVPVAVSERLPGEGDCDAEGRCWWFDGDWHLKQVRYRGAYDTHWLLAHAIPLPQVGEGES